MLLVSVMFAVIVTVVPVHVYKELNIIQTAAVEVRGLKTSAITRRRNPSKPVLEKYVLTPNVEPAHLDLDSVLRVCTHITRENNPVTQMKVVELHTSVTCCGPHPWRSATCKGEYNSVGYRVTEATVIRYSCCY
jgi:hypothetical protein